MKWLTHDRGLRALAATAFFVLAASRHDRCRGAAKTVVVLGTATQGGGFQIYGAAYAAALNEADATLTVEQRSTKGSTENAPLLAEGKIDIGLVTGEVTYEALAGIGRPPANLKIINAMYPNSGMFMVRGDSPYRTIADLKGKPIAWGAAGSGFVVLARYVFDALGMDISKDFSPIFSASAGDGPKMVLDGRAAAQWGGGVGWPGFVAISNGPAGARFITPTPEELKRILAKYPFIKPVTLPAGSYARPDGADRRRSAPGRSCSRAPRCPTRPRTSSRAPFTRRREALGAKLAQARESTLANTLAAAPRQDLIHSGRAALHARSGNIALEHPESGSRIPITIRNGSTAGGRGSQPTRSEIMNHRLHLVAFKSFSAVLLRFAMSAEPRTPNSSAPTRRPPRSSLPTAEKLRAFMERPDVVEKLKALGVSADEAKARVGAHERRRNPHDRRQAGHASRGRQDHQQRPPAHRRHHPRGRPSDHRALKA